MCLWLIHPHANTKVLCTERDMTASACVTTPERASGKELKFLGGSPTHRFLGAAGKDRLAALNHVRQVHQHRRQALAAIERVHRVVEVVEVRFWRCSRSSLTSDTQWQNLMANRLSIKAFCQQVTTGVKTEQGIILSHALTILL